MVGKRSTKDVATDEPSEDEIRWRTNLNGWVGRLALGDFGNQFLFAAFDEELGDVEIGRDVDRAARKHVAHDIGGITETAE